MRVAKLSDRGEREDASVGAEAVLASGGRLRRNGLAGNSKDQVISPTLGRTPRGHHKRRKARGEHVRIGKIISDWNAASGSYEGWTVCLPSPPRVALGAPRVDMARRWS